MKRISRPMFWMPNGEGGFTKINPKNSLYVKTVSWSDLEAKKIVLNQYLRHEDIAHVIGILSPFIDAYKRLEEHIHVSIGEAYISEDSIELRNLWHLYLIRGRELIDEIGRKMHKCYGLKQKLKGLNRKGFKNLRKIIGKQGSSESYITELLSLIDEYEQPLIEFIELRDRDKECRDTLVTAPVISPTGNPKGGLLEHKETNRKYDFVEYFFESYRNIREPLKITFSVFGFPKIPQFSIM